MRLLILAGLLLMASGCAAKAVPATPVPPDAAKGREGWIGTIITPCVRPLYCFRPPTAEQRAQDDADYRACMAGR